MATHRGQQHTCRKCERTVHHGMSCLDNRRLTIQKANVGERVKTTYASITAEAATVKSNLEEQNETMIDEGKIKQKQIHLHKHKQVTKGGKIQNQIRSPSVKRLVDKKVIDFVTVNSKRGRTRYTVKSKVMVKDRRDSL